MGSAAVLYTPQVLALATSLAAYRLDDDLTLRADARSRSCGSTLTLGLSFDPQGRVVRAGVRSQACAIGQASAAVFVQGVEGRSEAEIVAASQAVTSWVGGEAPLPAWPGLETIAAARDYPGRHGALLLPWTAALQLLSTSRPRG